MDQDPLWKDWGEAAESIETRGRRQRPQDGGVWSRGTSPSPPEGHEVRPHAERSNMAAADKKLSVRAADAQDLSDFRWVEEMDPHGASLRVLHNRGEVESKGLQEAKGSI